MLLLVESDGFRIRDFAGLQRHSAQNRRAAAMNETDKNKAQKRLVNMYTNKK